MIDKRKVHLMTKLAMYDEAQGVKDKKICKFFEVDYIGKKLLFNNIILIIFLGIIMFFKSFNFVMANNEEFSIQSLIDMSRGYIGYAIVIFVLYSLYNVYVYSKEYDRAKNNLDRYCGALNKLNKVEKVD